MLQANPNLTPNLVKAILQYTAQEYPGYSALRQGAGFLNSLGAVRLARFYATARPATQMPVQSVWSRQIIWGNHRLTGGVIKPSPTPGRTTSCGARPRRSATDGDNIVWGTRVDGDNIVWGTASDGDNIVWGTAGDGDNIVWGTAGRRRQHRVGHRLRRRRLRQHRLGHGGRRRQHRLGHRRRRRQHRLGHATTRRRLGNVDAGARLGHAGDDNIVWGTATTPTTSGDRVDRRRLGYTTSKVPLVESRSRVRRRSSTCRCRSNVRPDLPVGGL